MACDRRWRRIRYAIVAYEVGDLEAVAGRVRRRTQAKQNSRGGGGEGVEEEVVLLKPNTAGVGPGLTVALSTSQKPVMGGLWWRGTGIRDSDWGKKDEKGCF